MTYTHRSPSAADQNSSRCPRFFRLGLRFLAAGFLVAAVGCQEDAESPTGPETAPALALGATQALAFYQVDGGLEHTCGITTDRRAYCWGKGYSGELGDGSSGWGLMRLTPVEVRGGHQFRQVSAGQDHTCGVTMEYQAYCWGGNYAAQLGDGTTSDRSIPVRVAGGLRFLQVDASFSAHTCGVTYPDRRVYCWGSNIYGQLGEGTATWHKTPFPIASALRFRHVSGGRDHTCGVTTANDVFCWGSNDDGQVGDGSTRRRRREPALVAGGYSFHQVAAGHHHTCAVTTGDKAFCWGFGGNGRIGDGKTLQRSTPRAVAGRHQFDRVTAGGAHTCGETSGNRAYCWGRNASGQLGDGTTVERLRPVAVSGGHSFSQVSVGSFQSCGVTPGSVAFCWGANAHGEVGDGSTTNRSKPVPVAEPM